MKKELQKKLGITDSLVETALKIALPIVPADPNAAPIPMDSPPEIKRVPREQLFQKRNKAETEIKEFFDPSKTGIVGQIARDALRRLGPKLKQLNAPEAGGAGSGGKPPATIAPPAGPPPGGGNPQLGGPPNIPKLEGPANFGPIKGRMFDVGGPVTTPKTPPLPLLNPKTPTIKKTSTGEDDSSVVAPPSVKFDTIKKTSTGEDNPTIAPPSVKFDTVKKTSTGEDNPTIAPPKVDLTKPIAKISGTLPSTPSLKMNMPKTTIGGGDNNNIDTMTIEPALGPTPTPPPTSDKSVIEKPKAPIINKKTIPTAIKAPKPELSSDDLNSISLNLAKGQSTSSAAGDNPNDKLRAQKRIAAERIKNRMDTIASENFVFHAKYGIGEILTITENKYDVMFEHGIEKQIGSEFLNFFLNESPDNVVNQLPVGNGSGGSENNYDNSVMLLMLLADKCVKLAKILQTNPQMQDFTSDKINSALNSINNVFDYVTQINSGNPNIVINPNTKDQ